MFGQEPPDGLINSTITVAKQIIYKNRQIKRNYSIEEFKSTLYHQMKMEEYMARTNNTKFKF